MTLEYAQYTNKGDRANNEDSYAVTKNAESYCFVVADGLGGHGQGEVASQIAVNTTRDIFEQYGYGESFFFNVFYTAQENIIREQDKSNTKFQMKTTLSILVIHGGCAYRAHIGDSRIYHFKGKRIKDRTLDHSVPQRMVTFGRLKESEIRGHADRSKLLHVLGVRDEDPAFECMEEIQLMGDHRFLLCSDGFWEIIDEKTMTKCLRLSGNAEEWLHSMTKRVALSLADKDNYTAIAVEVKA